MHRTTIPDLTADTDNYLKLKQVYERKSEQDRDELQQITKEILSGTNREIGIDEIKTFIEHIFNLNFIAYRYTHL